MDKSPDAFRTISEVADELDVPQHVLRFWETRFPQIKPLKRGGGRRYYRRDDVDLLRGIRHLLYGEGYTIKGVQRIFTEQGVRFVQLIGRGDQRAPSPGDDHRSEPEEDESEEAGKEATSSSRITSAPRGSRSGSPSEKAGRAPGQEVRSVSATDCVLLKDALSELAECERVLKTLATADEPGGLDEAQ